MFSYQRGKHFSLLDMASFLFRDFKVKITKQSLHSRFDHKAVSFLKGCLDLLVTKKIHYHGEKPQLQSKFNRVRIKDSTKFALPDSFSGYYKGYGGVLHNSSSMISIQYEYDFLSGKSLDLRLTQGTHNDQRDSADFTHDIREKDLFLRDLGYCTLPFLKLVDSAKAFFISRLYPKTTLYVDQYSAEPLEVRDYFRKLKKYGLEYIEANVFIGKKDRIPVRAIISLADEITYQKRIRKTAKQAKSTGNKVSEAFKTRAKLNIMVTNVPKNMILAQNIRKVYAIRWQIELLFKVWKSQVTIKEFTTSNIHRFECQLYGKLIWIILNLNIFHWIQQRTFVKKKFLCSVWKYFKLIRNLQNELITALKSSNNIAQLLEDLLELAPNLLKLEKKKHKDSLNQLVNYLN
jgi:hypothetical protein